MINSYKSFKGTVVNQTLPSSQGGPLGITLAIPLRRETFSPPLLLLLHLSKVFTEFGFISSVSSLSSRSIDISELVSNSSSSGAEGGVGGGEGRLENPSLNSFSRSIATIRSNPSSRAISRDVLPSLEVSDNLYKILNLFFTFFYVFCHQ